MYAWNAASFTAIFSVRHCCCDDALRAKVDKVIQVALREVDKDKPPTTVGSRLGKRLKTQYDYRSDEFLKAMSGLVESEK